MEFDEIVDVAYDMQIAYENLRTRGEAVEQVGKKHPLADTNMLRGMWLAIDAWIDMDGVKGKGK